jgi:penicillin-binding protein 1C
MRHLFRRFFSFIKRHRRSTLFATGLLLAWYWFSLPDPLFRSPVSLVLEDRRGDLLGARIAADGQWRFPPLDSVPEKFAAALVTFEDKRFYRHPGVDPLAIGRAFWQNLRAGRIVSGGSTLTMQVIRLARRNKPRTLWEKLVESMLATRLELRYSKEEILALYASYAPFGGNVVGLEAAAWRYYGKQPALLSWGEAATLAVLPNSPAMIHPGRNEENLLAKRNRLLGQMSKQGLLDRVSWELALTEPLPEAPHPLPRLAPHLLDRAAASRDLPGRGSRFRSTIDHALQQQVNDILERHHRRLRRNQIHNLAALIIDVERQEVVAYAGNVPGVDAEHAPAVDIVTAPRSTGSILKPFLYTLVLQEGQLLPYSLVPDVPSNINGFRPENFNREFAGAVPARRALSRSLNVPMVHMLRDYGLGKFHYALQELGFRTISFPPDHYGLTLILGGAEATLWEITNAYAGMARTLLHFYPYDGRYDPRDFDAAHYLQPNENAGQQESPLLPEPPLLGAANIWFTFEAMQQLERPGSEGQWEAFSSSRRLAWKTGTSYGFRDAWAVGVTPRYAIGVWAGNADGEGRPGLVGVRAAAPVLFDLADLLPGGEWFDPPYDEMMRLPVCRQSGYRALRICPADTLWVPKAGTRVGGCPFHQIVALSPDEQWRVNASCEAPDRIRRKPWFVLPPLQEHYYQKREPGYRALPPLRSDCTAPASEMTGANMQLIYPRYPTRIYVPVDLNGQRQRTVFTVSHRHSEMTIYWHLDEAYIGSTTTFHQMELDPPAGKHRLTLVDEQGGRLEQTFQIIERRK